MRLTIPIRIFIITGLVVSFIYFPACNESSRTVNSANPELTNSTVPYAATPEGPSLRPILFSQVAAVQGLLWMLIVVME